MGPRPALAGLPRHAVCSGGRDEFIAIGDAVRRTLLVLALAGCATQQERTCAEADSDRLVLHVDSPGTFTKLVVTYSPFPAAPQTFETASTTKYDVVYMSGFHPDAPSAANIVAYDDVGTAIAHGELSGFNLSMITDDGCSYYEEVPAQLIAY